MTATERAPGSAPWTELVARSRDYESRTLEALLAAWWSTGAPPPRACLATILSDLARFATEAGTLSTVLSAGEVYFDRGAMARVESQASPSVHAVAALLGALSGTTVSARTRAELLAAIRDTLGAPAPHGELLLQIESVRAGESGWRMDARASRPNSRARAGEGASASVKRSGSRARSSSRLRRREVSTARSAQSVVTAAARATPPPLPKKKAALDAGLPSQEFELGRPVLRHSLSRTSPTSVMMAPAARASRRAGYSLETPIAVDSGAGLRVYGWMTFMLVLAGLSGWIAMT